jgi:hypothetical protein
VAACGDSGDDTAAATSATASVTAATAAQQAAARTCDLSARSDLGLSGTVVFDHIDGLDPGAHPIRTTAPNGDALALPRLNGCDPEQLTKTALSLLACYVSTADENCLSALTVRPELHGVIRALRDDMGVSGDGVQLAIFSGTAAPARFDVWTKNRQTVVELAGGDLRIQPLVDNFGDNSWQGPWTRAYAGLPPIPYVATEFMMSFGLQDDGEPRLLFFTFNLDNVSG